MTTAIIPVITTFLGGLVGFVFGRLYERSNPKQR